MTRSIIVTGTVQCMTCFSVQTA